MDACSASGRDSIWGRGQVCSWPVMDAAAVQAQGPPTMPLPVQVQLCRSFSSPKMQVCPGDRAQRLSLSGQGGWEHRQLCELRVLEEGMDPVHNPPWAAQPTRLAPRSRTRNVGPRGFQVDELPGPSRRELRGHVGTHCQCWAGTGVGCPSQEVSCSGSSLKSRASASQRNECPFLIASVGSWICREQLSFPFISPA